MRCHVSTLSECSSKARELLLTAMNSGLKDDMTALLTQGGVLHRNHPFTSPASGTALTTHAELHAAEGAGGVRYRNQPRGAHGVLEAGVGKDSRPGRGDEDESPRRGRIANSSRARPRRRRRNGHQFKACILEQQTPEGMCAYAWHGSGKLYVSTQPSRRDSAVHRRAQQQQQ